MLSRLGVYFYYRVILPDTRKSNYTEEIEPVGLWTKYHISFRQIILGYYQQKKYFCKYLTCWDKLQSQGLERVVERIFFACHSYFLTTLPRAEILRRNNARAWVSMVLYLKK